MERTLKTFRLDPKVLKDIEGIAKQENRTMNNMVDTILKEYAKAHKIVKK